MRAKVPTLVLFALGVLPASARAHTPGINLSWGACATDAASRQRCYTCDGHAGAPFVFQGSFRLDVPMADFLSATATLDLTFMDVSGNAVLMPDFWAMNTGDCAAPHFHAVDPDTAGGCDPSNYVGKTSSGYVASYSTGRPRLYVDWTTDVPPPALLAGQLYPAFAMTMDADGAIAGGCSGCATGAMIVLREIDVNSGSDVRYITAQDVRNWIQWQGTASNPCQTTPTRASTWGAIKALYRCPPAPHGSTRTRAVSAAARPRE